MQVVKFVAAMLVGAAAVVVIGFLSIGYYLSPQDKLQKADAIIAISGGETDSRAKEAVSLYKQNYAPKLVFSGAALDPSGPSNAQAMKAIAKNEGVPVADILIEEGSKNTQQNAQAVADLLADGHVKKIILVTSPYHQRRAGINFERAFGKQVEIINHSATDQSWRRSHWWATPYSFQLTISELQKTLYVLSSSEAN